jgi:hypothetical protein
MQCTRLPGWHSSFEVTIACPERSENDVTKAGCFWDKPYGIRKTVTRNNMAMKLIQEDISAAIC